MEAATLGIIIPVILWLLALSFYGGRLWERVKNNAQTIDKNQAINEKHHQQNREDHRLLFNKQDEIIKMLRNGHGNSG